MNLSFNLILGLFLLAPGFAIFAGIYHGSRLGPVESPPPPPGSILALAIVAVGALVAHLFGATAFLAQDFYCGRWECFGVTYNANHYTSVLMVASGKASVASSEAVSILLALVILTGSAFFSTRWILGRFTSRTTLPKVLYGWLADVAIAESENEAVLAYVVSDIQEGGTVVGYEGVVANLTTNADREITSILLASCETFYLRVTPKGVTRTKAPRTAPIPQLYLDKSRIKNLALERLRFE